MTKSNWGKVENKVLVRCEKANRYIIEDDLDTALKKIMKNTFFSPEYPISYEPKLIRWEDERKVIHIYAVNCVSGTCDYAEGITITPLYEYGE